jgi:Fe-S-cluster containining protein
MSECTCDRCQKACQNKPGWFLPGEAEKAAELLGMPLPEFFRTKLGVDWYEGEKPVFVLSPAITTMPAGETFPSDPMGTCVFFESGRCTIHAAKPFECRMFLHGQQFDETDKRHADVAAAWVNHQAQIEELYGDEPEAVEEDALSALMSLFGIY